MKITLLSSSDSQGGAAIAARRLLNALIKGKRADVQLLVRHNKLTESPEIVPVLQLKRFQSSELHPKFVLEKLIFSFFQKSKASRFLFSTNLFGFPVSESPMVINSDVLHLHWINNSFISLRELKKLADSGKPIVWTLHDMWAFTGGCHYAGECEGFLKSCGNCPLLAKPDPNDLSHRLWTEKQTIYKNANLSIVTCSQWLADKVSSSGLLGYHAPTVIPNPIDRTVFSERDKAQTRKSLNLPENKFLLLFGAATVSDRRKGLNFLLEALSKLQNRFLIKASEIAIVIVGKTKGQPISVPGFQIFDLGSIRSEEKMAELYSAADCFILPSLEDNLPNTIMESMSCGTPVIAFNSGGIPEMIHHKKTGYLAKSQSSEELMNGIVWMMDSENRNQCSKHAVEFVCENYSEKIVTEKYFSLYRKLLGQS